MVVSAWKESGNMIFSYVEVDRPPGRMLGSATNGEWVRARLLIANIPIAYISAHLY
jgi:hypothetical protein